MEAAPDTHWETAMQRRPARSTLVSVAVLASLATALAGCTSAGSAGTVGGTPSTAPAPVTPSTAPTSPSTAPTSPSTAPTSPSPTTTSRTVVVTLEPVRRSGALAAGWSAGPLDPSTQVECADASPSPAALSSAVMACSPSAATADTCWASASAGQVLCMLDPWSHRLARYAALGALPKQVPPVAHALPLGLQLADGRRCRLRDGGSGEYQQQHPGWVDWYYCDASISPALWGPQGTTAPIDRSGPVWTVQLGSTTGALTTAAVVKAFYVATAP